MKTFSALLFVLFLIPFTQRSCSTDSRELPAAVVKTNCIHEAPEAYGYSLDYWRKDTIYYHKTFPGFEQETAIAVSIFAEAMGKHIIPRTDNPDLVIDMGFIDGPGRLDAEGNLRNTLGISEFPRTDDLIGTPVTITLDSLDLGGLEGAVFRDFFVLMSSIDILNGEIISSKPTTISR